MGERIVDVIGFQKIYGLYGLKHHIVEIRGGVTRRDNDERQTREDSATQPLGYWKAEFRNITKYLDKYDQMQAVIFIHFRVRGVWVGQHYTRDMTCNPEIGRQITFNDD